MSGDDSRVPHEEPSLPPSAAKAWLKLLRAKGITGTGNRVIRTLPDLVCGQRLVPGLGLFQHVLNEIAEAAL
jgi:hypothetical protein